VASVPYSHQQTCTSRPAARVQLDRRDGVAHLVGGPWSESRPTVAIRSASTKVILAFRRLQGGSRPGHPALMLHPTRAPRIAIRDVAEREGGQAEMAMTRERGPRHVGGAINAGGQESIPATRVAQAPHPPPTKRPK